MSQKIIIKITRLFFAGSAAVNLTACSQCLDYDLRGMSGGFTTATAVQTAVADRPNPDNRGVISYPNYQVAVARQGDTITDVANRIGLPPAEVAKYNGIQTNIPLRTGEIVALPSRVPEQTGANIGDIQTSLLDVTSLASNAINDVQPTPPVENIVKSESAPTKNPVQKIEKEPIRHKVERGETAYTIARLYQVSAKSLAEWNGLGADYAVREGQYLLIPIARTPAPTRSESSITTAPGTGSATPTPPSATMPLPADDTANPPNIPPADELAADVGKTTKPIKQTAMAIPVTGSIIREYSKGRNEGIDIKAAPGSPVKAANNGTVAAITKSAEGVPIIVIRHENNILTVYANVDDVKVTKGDKVQRNQTIASLSSIDNDAYVHFEVRDGFDSVDPAPYLK
ncbi:MAG TPA: peptidase M23 [Rhodobacteraceae bacterium]|nr:peptidase M23 [Paracoccaceae bacterium]